MRGVDESGEEERKGKVTELQNDVTPIGAVGTPAYATTSGSIRKGRRSSAWDLSVELQDAGMEVVVPGSGPQLEKEKEMKLEKRLKPEPLTAGSTNNSVVKLPPQREEEVESTKLDNELLDMLSWRWAQGRQTQA
ncbi:hypothetical protein BJY04DRAFT_189502 [Aspergillus karnatakaensis]|uniref:uncharacterized protein n=1 Tax=Aspergillus karnatakaensis TaxID=1810916 RepID=UPI003CCDCE3F